MIRVRLRAMYLGRCQFSLSSPGGGKGELWGSPMTRRRILLVAAGARFASFLPKAAATEAAMADAIRAVIGESEAQRGKVELELPPIVENGNTVPLAVSVDSPQSLAATLICCRRQVVASWYWVRKCRHAPRAALWRR